MPRKKGTTTTKTTTRKKAASKPKEAPQQSSLAMARAQLAKALGPKDTSRVELDMSRLKRPHPHLPTGSFIIDWLIGGAPNKFGVSPCPGAPKGKIWNIYGHESSGKTTICKTTAASVCRNGGTVGFLDYEYAFDPSYAAALGVPVTDPNRFELRQPLTLEDGFKILWVWASAGVDLIIIDSAGAGVPKTLFEQSVDQIGDEIRMGLVASRWSTFLPKLNGVLMRTGSALMATSQIRSGGFGGGGGEQTAVQGGRAWKFYSSIRMKLQRVSTEKATSYDALSHKSDQTAMGIKVKAKLDKCKVSANAHHEAFFYIRHGEGVDDLRSIIDIAIAHGVIKKSGAWLAWEREDGDDIRGQGMEKFRDAIATSEGAFATLYRQVAHLITEKGAERTMEEEEEMYEDPTLAELEAVMGSLDGVTTTIGDDEDDGDDAVEDDDGDDDAADDE